MPSLIIVDLAVCQDWYIFINFVLIYLKKVVEPDLIIWKNIIG